MFGLQQEIAGTYTTSENTQIRLVEENRHRKGICEIRLSLQEPFEGKSVHCLGNSQLTIQGDRGVWIFSIP